MMTPGFFGERLFDDFFDDFWRFPEPAGRPDRKELRRFEPAMPGLMRTDVREQDDCYEVDMDLPGFRKEDLTLELKDGNLVIRAVRTQDNDQQDAQTGSYIRRERFVGSMSRSFYVGETVKQEDIRARYDNGVLKLTIPKPAQKKPEIPEKKYIAIEG